jgi:hypothetical protein
MDRVISRDTIVDIVRREVASYADAKGLNAEFYYVENPAQDLYAIIAIPHKRQSLGLVPLAVRIVGNKVIIERDTNADPLYAALREQGIPDEQIELAYEHDPSTKDS